MKEEAGNVTRRVCGKDRASLVMDNLFTLNFQAFGESHENSHTATIIFFLNQNEGYMRKRGKKEGQREKKRKKE